MHRVPRLLLLGLLLVAVLPPGMARAGLRDAAVIDTYAWQQMAAHALPGLAIGIVEGDSVIYLRGFGSAGPDGRVVTPQTPFAIGALTASFTALAVLQLAEAGRIDLDAPVQRYLTWFRVADPQASARISVRQLLQHTSGLPATAGMWAASPGADSSLEQRVRQLASVELVHPPGVAFQRSGANDAVLGLLVETVAGQPYADYIAQRIFAPLGMQHSGVAQQRDLATGYHNWFGLPVAARPIALTPGDTPDVGIAASAEDMSRYLLAQLNGGRVGEVTIASPAMIVSMQQPSGVANSNYGMGWTTRTVAGRAMLGQVGAMPLYEAAMIGDPLTRRGVVVLANSASFRLGVQPAVWSIAAGVMSLLAGQQLPSVTLAGWSYGQWIRVLLGVLLVIVMLGILKLVGIDVWRWYWRARQRRPPFRVVLGALVNLAVAEVLFSLPWLLGVPAWALYRRAPDVSIVVAAYALLLLLKGLARLALVVAAELRASQRRARVRSRRQLTG